MILLRSTVFGPAALLLGLAACGGAGEALIPAPTVRTHPPAHHGGVVPRSYIVAFRTRSGATTRAYASFADEAAFHHRQMLDDLKVDARVAALRFIATVDLANPHALGPPPGLPAPRPLRLSWTAADQDEQPAALTTVTFTSDAEATAALAEWEARGALWFAEPNYVNTSSDSVYTPAVAAAYQSAGIWWHQSIKLPAALDLLAQQSPANVTAPVIAVLDSGLDISNPWITSHVYRPTHIGGRGCANDLNGCDVTAATASSLGNGHVYPYLTSSYGAPCPYADAPPRSAQSIEHGTCMHGTHVAGIIAATLDGAGGDAIGGVCPVCLILPVKIIKKGDEGRGVASDDAILSGLKYVSHFGSLVRVVNSSFGKYDRSRSVALLVAVLSHGPNDMLVVGAASNENSMLRSYPAALPEALAVAAVGKDDAKAQYSNFGPWVSVAAPGGDSRRGLPQIRSTIPGPNGKGDLQGTSMAAPVVAGVAGLVLSVHPERAGQLLRESLILTADARLYDASVDAGNNLTYYDPKATGDAFRTPLLGSGIIDAAAAIDGTGRTGQLAPDTNTTVTRGCSAVPAGTRAPPWTLLLGLVPAAAVARRRRATAALS